MKTLGLLRHAKSDWSAGDTRDFDRGLNQRGQRGAALIGAHIAQHGLAWDRIVASPAARVRLTLDKALPGRAVTWDERLYLASAAAIMDLLPEIGGDAASVLIAGHNPGLGDMLFELVAPSNENALYDEAKVKFPTAAYAVFELAIADWRDLKPGCGTLVHFTRPRDLDTELGRPE